MAKGTSKTDRGKAAAERPRSLDIAATGITTGQDFANFMSALMSDLISGAVAPNIGNAACNAGGKLLKAVEMQHKYGTMNQDGTGKVLKLAMGAPLIQTPPAPTEH